MDIVVKAVGAGSILAVLYFTMKFFGNRNLQKKKIQKKLKRKNAKKSRKQSKKAK